PQPLPPRRPPVHRHHDARPVLPNRLQRLLGAGVGLGVEARKRQPLADRLPHVLFVIDDGHLHRARHGSPHSAACVFAANMGSWTSNTAPPPGALRAVSRPPRSFTMPEEMASPRPTPSPGFFVV